MAIRAAVKYRALTATPSALPTAATGFQAVVPVATVNYRDINLRAAVKYQALSATPSALPVAVLTVSYQDIAAGLSWRNLFAHDVHVNAIQTVYPLGDVFSADDSVAFATQSVLADVFGATEQVSLAVSAAASDDFSLSDAQVIEIATAVQDNFVIAEAHEIDAGAAILDTLTASDLLFVDVENVIDNQQFRLDDALTFSLVNQLSDGTIVSELFAFNASTQVQDTSTINDALSLSSRIDLSDSFGVSESLTYELVMTAGSRLNQSLIGSIILNS